MWPRRRQEVCVNPIAPSEAVAIAEQVICTNRDTRQEPNRAKAVKQPIEEFWDLDEILAFRRGV